MSWQKDLITVIEQEPELWLDYFAGKRLAGELPALKTKRFGPPTFALNTVWFTLWALGKCSLRQLFSGSRYEKCRFLVLATSRNQINATSSTIEGLRAKGHSVLGISKKKRLKKHGDQMLYVPLTYHVKDILRALIAYRNHGRVLYHQLETIKTGGAKSYFLEIAKVYLYLAYFYRTLSTVAPTYVVTSNDHSALNRCMLAIAHHLQIKTVYVQHASVSPLFPALLFDYAFLDGPAAAGIYADCEDNRPNTLTRVVKPVIIYSGQKKSLTKRPAREQSVVGIAVNKLDDIAAVTEVIRLLTGHGLKVKTRWHPRQSQRDIRELEKQSEQAGNYCLSNPEKESVDDFLDSIGWLVAGNSSIHLEGAIKGVSPIYYEFAPTPQSDYYGYVEKGLVKHVASKEALVATLTLETPPEFNKEAVRFYSSTFGTEWEGREGELVAEHLSSYLPLDSQTHPPSRHD